MAKDEAEAVGGGDYRGSCRACCGICSSLTSRAPALIKLYFSILTYTEITMAGLQGIAYFHP